MVGMFASEASKSYSASPIVLRQTVRPDETAYLDYMFNDASFPKSQGLRNRYDHAHSPIADPDAEGIRSDYYRMLTLLVAITLKINDELSAATGRGRLENFVDWPYYDESVLEFIKKMTTKKA